MFVLESYKRNRRAKKEAWEAARDKWATSSPYNYRREYEDKYPRPGINWSGVGEAAPFIIGFMVIGLLFYVMFFAPRPKPDPNNPNRCDVVVHKGDKVALRGSDFTGSKGDVIEQRSNCDVSLTLTTSTWTVKRCKEVSGNYCEKPKENGEILTASDTDIIKL